MGLAIVGILLNLLALSGIPGLMEEESMDMPMFFTVFCVFWGISVLGLLLCAAGMKKGGAILIMIGSIAFVPLGLVAMIGAKKMMAPAGDDLEARRKLAESKND